jgi:hypothetical protein
MLVFFKFLKGASEAPAPLGGSGGRLLRGCG